MNSRFDPEDNSFQHLDKRFRLKADIVLTKVKNSYLRFSDKSELSVAHIFRRSSPLSQLIFSAQLWSICWISYASQLLSRLILLSLTKFLENYRRVPRFSPKTQPIGTFSRGKCDSLRSLVTKIWLNYNLNFVKLVFRRSKKSLRFRNNWGNATSARHLVWECLQISTQEFRSSSTHSCKSIQ